MRSSSSLFIAAVHESLRGTRQKISAAQKNLGSYLRTRRLAGDLETMIGYRCQTFDMSSYCLARQGSDGRGLPLTPILPCCLATQRFLCAALENWYGGRFKLRRGGLE